ncbi:MAG TPA: alpha/beta hydrolase [Pseudonocardia sp.]|jgi:pimeloyl-ACP methyl ester carboxylesterase|nr:alpha/beta hydrolase [Pseudonocardia sp.]
MTTYVLVPGFWLGGWAWDGVATRLRAQGHEVLALTPGGVAERSAEADATIESRIADVVTVLRELRDVVLVGHSGAGVVVVAAAERAREHVSRMVLVDTGPMPEGMAQLDFNPPDVRAQVERQLAEHRGWPMPDRAWLTENGSSTDGLDDEEFGRLYARATPEPVGTVTGSARRAAEPDRTLPKTVIACSFTEAEARALIDAGVPAFAEMGGPEWSFVELPTGHWPMFSEPDALTGLLVRIPAQLSS